MTDEEKQLFLSMIVELSGRIETMANAQILLLESAGKFQDQIEELTTKIDAGLSLQPLVERALGVLVSPQYATNSHAH